MSHITRYCCRFKQSSAGSYSAEALIGSQQYGHQQAGHQSYQGQQYQYQAGPEQDMHYSGGYHLPGYQSAAQYTGPVQQQQQQHRPARRHTARKGKTDMPPPPYVEYSGGGGGEDFLPPIAPCPPLTNFNLSAIFPEMGGGGGKMYAPAPAPSKHDKQPAFVPSFNPPPPPFNA